MNRAGLKRVRKTVRGKRGSVQRTYWVKAGEFAKKHGAKIAGLALIAGGAYAAHKYGVPRARQYVHTQATQAAHAVLNAKRHEYTQKANKALRAAPSSLGKVTGAALRFSAQNAGRVGHAAGRSAVWAIKQVPGALKWPAKQVPHIVRGVGQFAGGFYRGVRGAK
jgi:hypothetical protein